MGGGGGSNLTPRKEKKRAGGGGGAEQGQVILKGWGDTTSYEVVLPQPRSWTQLHK